MQPPNPLDKYESHTYQFILCAANSTEGVRQLVVGDNGETNDVNFLNKISTATLGNEIVPNSGTYLILDTRRTSEFSIANLAYDIYLSNGNAPQDSLSLATSIMMQVIDPSGVGFFNYFKHLIDNKFECDITGITFLLHIMFIGHTDEGKTDIVHSTYMPLIIGETFNLSDFSTKGGVYDLSFMPINMGGVTHLSSFNQLYSAIPFKGKEGLLGNMIQAFENELNIRSVNWFNRFNPKSLNETSEKGTSKQKFGRLVQYMITIPPEWFYYEINSIPNNSMEIQWHNIAVEKGIGTTPTSTTPTSTTPKTPEQIKQEEAAVLKQQTEDINAGKASEVIAASTAATNSGSSGHDILHSTAVNMTVEDGINSILRSTAAINELAGAQAKIDGRVFIYKILTSITSDLETVLVHYDVVAYSLPDTNKAKEIEESQKIKNGNTPSTHSPDGMKGITSSNSMVFDYIFSGKNTDILDMQIKVNNLYIGLMDVGRVGQLAVQANAGSSQTKKADRPEIEDKETYGHVTRYQPLIPPPKTAEEFHNFGGMPNVEQAGAKERMSGKQEFAKALSDLNVTSLVPEMKIRGNPNILSRYTIGKIQGHIKLAGNIKDYLALASNDVTLAQNTAWEYKSTGQNVGKAVTAGASKIVADHFKHRVYIDEISKAFNTDLRKLEEGIKTNPNDKDGSFLTAGTWALVNIYGPSDYSFSNVIGSNGGKDNTNYDNYKTQLFYDSWYLVSKVSNSFDHGSFTQTLELRAVDLYGAYGQLNQVKTKVGDEK